MIDILAATADTLNIIAQTGLEDGIGNIIRLLRIVAFMLAVGALIIAGIMFAQGRVEAAIYGVVAAGLLALSGAIVKFAFEQTGDDLGIPL